MTADRPRLAAAAEAVFPVVVELHGCLHLPDSTMQQLRYALAPHVPERDELAAGLRMLLGTAFVYGATDRRKAGWDIAMGQIRALLARHAPEPTDA